MIGALAYPLPLCRLGGSHDEGSGGHDCRLTAEQLLLVSREQEVPGRGVHRQDSPQLLPFEGVMQHAEECTQGALPPVHLSLLPHSAMCLTFIKVQ